MGTACLYAEGQLFHRQPKSFQSSLKWPQSQCKYRQFRVPWFVFLSSPPSAFFHLMRKQCMSFIWRTARGQLHGLLLGYLKKSMSTKSSSRSACPMTGLKKSSEIRLGVMLCSMEAVRRIWAKRSWSPGWRIWTTSLRACWASCCRLSTNRAAFKSGTSVKCEDTRVNYTDSRDCTCIS